MECIFKSPGRSGFLHITDNWKIVDAEFELEMNGLILDFNRMTNGSLKTKQTLRADEKKKIKPQIGN
jgi:hypothetical protein